MGHILSLIAVCVKNAGQAKALIMVLAKYLTDEHTAEIIAELEKTIGVISPTKSAIANKAIDQIEAAAQVIAPNPAGWKPPKVAQ